MPFQSSSCVYVNVVTRAARCSRCTMVALELPFRGSICAHAAEGGAAGARVTLDRIPLLVGNLRLEGLRVCIKCAHAAAHSGEKPG